MSFGPTSLLGKQAKAGGRLIPFAVLAWVFLSLPQNSLAQATFVGRDTAGSGLVATATRTRQSPSVVSGPLLGYIFDPDQRQLRRISGIPGAAVTGPAIDLGHLLSLVQVSPRHDYALVVDSESGRMLLADFGRGQVSVRSLSEFAPADRIVFSPTGSSAALYDRDKRLVQIVAGLPASPFKQRDIDLAALPALVTAMAVSDDGGVLLVATADDRGGTLLALTEQAGAVHVAAVGSVMGMTFARDSRDALIADHVRNELILIRDVTGAAASFVLADREDGIAQPIGVGVSNDGRRAFAANRASNTVLTVALDGGPPLLTGCRCRITGLQPLRGNGVFLLNAATDSPLYVFDGSRTEPRTVFVPNSRATSKRLVAPVPPRRRGPQ